MDIPQFKDVLQKISVFKRHSSLFIPAIIGLVGVLLFIPAQLMNSKLKAQISEESISIRGKQVTSLRQDTPPSDQWKVEKERQQAYKNDANQISLLAKELTERQLLSDRIFPNPKDDSISLFKRFGQLFREGIDELLKGLNSGECPTREELQRSVGGLSGGSRKGRRSTRVALSGSGTEIRDALCRDKAETARVYCNPAVLSGYEFWREYQYAGTPEAVKDCWYYQLGYWIIEDVVDTIEVVNSGSKNVFESPVKRLLGVSFSRMGGGSGSRDTAKDSRPQYVLTTFDVLTITAPYTSRICNEEVDVVHFNVRVLVNTKAVLRFMQDLCSAKQHVTRGTSGQIQGPRNAKHNQITILESSITSVDRQDEAHEFYRYGEDAVVELDLICEYVFSKKGYDEIKPLWVKQEQIVPVDPMSMDSRRAPAGRTTRTTTRVNE
jgi:hypothetical protein